MSAVKLKAKTRSKKINNNNLMMNFGRFVMVFRCCHIHCTYNFVCCMRCLLRFAVFDARVDMGIQELVSIEWATIMVYFSALVKTIKCAVCFQFKSIVIALNQRQQQRKSHTCLRSIYWNKIFTFEAPTRVSLLSHYYNIATHGENEKISSLDWICINWSIFMYLKSW